MSGVTDRLAPFAVEYRPDGVTVRLGGLARLFTWRTSVEASRSQMVGVTVVERSELEALIDHRSLGFGTHDGARRPGHTRIGPMLGRGIAGPHFWAVRAGPPTMRLVAIDLRDHEFVRLVVEADDPDALASAVAGEG